MSPVALALLALTVAGAGGGESGASAALMQVCRDTHGAFQADAAVKACGSAAAAAAGLPRELRVEALRRLADAYLLGKQDELAERALVQMLVLDDAAGVGADAGPKLRDALARARGTLEVAGQIRARHGVGRDHGVDVIQLELHDPLRRVSRVTVRVKHGERMAVGALERTGAAGKRSTWRGPLPVLPGVVAVDYQLVLEGNNGRALLVDADLRGDAEQTPAPTTPAGALGLKALKECGGAALVGLGSMPTIIGCVGLGLVGDTDPAPALTMLAVGAAMVGVGALVLFVPLGES